MLRSGDTEGRGRIIQNWLDKGVEVGLDLLDFPSIIFYQIPIPSGSPPGGPGGYLREGR